jgi:hypothetical protein
MTTLHADGNGHAPAYGPRGHPAVMGLQEEGYHEAYDEKREHETHADPMADHTRDVITTAEMEVGHDIPPFLRTNNRWSYFTEYVDFWRWEKLHWVMFAFWIAAAIFTLMVFPPGSLLMFALAGRFRNMAWYDRFVYAMFGVNRTIMLVD